MASRGYSVDLESLRFHTPPGEKIPPIVLDFYDWVAALKDNTELGYFSLAGDRLDDAWIEDGTRLSSSFVVFLTMMDGSRIGWWRPAGESLAESPVVMLGGQGAIAVLGRDAPEFFVRWSKRRIAVRELFPEDEHGVDEVGAGIEKLSAWLSARGLAGGVSEDDELETRGAALKVWFNDWSKERNARAKDDPQRQALAQQLRKIIKLPPGPKRRSRGMADVLVTGTECRVYPNLAGHNPAPVSEAFETALRGFRERDAQELPEAGLWYRAFIEFGHEGITTFHRGYLTEPNPDKFRLDDTGLRQDFARMPRSPYWTPDWLRSRL